jgi:adenosine deaminase
MTPTVEHVRALPKAELHVHVEGAAPPQTIAELARCNRVDLGVDDPADLYSYDGLAGFLRVYDIVCRSMQHTDDVRRVTYEALAIAAAAGVRYREMFFSPTFLLRHGVTFDTIWSGIAAGIEDAATDHAIVCRMILDVDKPSGAGAAAAGGPPRAGSGATRRTGRGAESRTAAGAGRFPALSRGARVSVAAGLGA